MDSDRDYRDLRLQRHQERPPLEREQRTGSAAGPFGKREKRVAPPQRFGDPEVPKKWLKEKRPDLYKAVFQREEDSSQELIDLGRRFGGKSVAEAIVKYLDQHKEINAVFWRRGGRTVTRKAIEPHGSKFYGNFIFDNRYELMNKAATFPGDIWRLAEERVDRVVDKLGEALPSLKIDLTEDLKETGGRRDIDKGR